MRTGGREREAEVVEIEVLCGEQVEHFSAQCGREGDFSVGASVEFEVSPPVSDGIDRSFQSFGIRERQLEQRVETLPFGAC